MLVSRAEQFLYLIWFFFSSYNITDAGVRKIPKQIDEFYQRLDKASKVQEERLKKQRDVLEKARDFYGYELDLRDIRYVNANELFFCSKLALRIFSTYYFDPLFSDWKSFKNQNTRKKRRKQRNRRKRSQKNKKTKQM